MLWFSRVVLAVRGRLVHRWAVHSAALGTEQLLAINTELARRLPVRVRLLFLMLAVISLLETVRWGGAQSGGLPAWATLAGAVGWGVVTVLMLLSLVALSVVRWTDRDLVLASVWACFVFGAASLAEAGPRIAAGSIGAEIGATALAALGAVIGALIVPWTLADALAVLLPLWVLSAVEAGLVVALRRTGDAILGPVAVFPMLALVALFFCDWRERGAQERVSRATRRGFVKLVRELVDARTIHEALLPPRVVDGPVRVEYAYRPWMEIGGDFLFVHPLPGEEPDPHGAVTVVVIDVTGHGIAAALTVNRLHGELTRVFRTSPGATPQEVLACLNEYARVMLARHSMYPSALVLQIVPDAGGAGGELRWASAGHPPAIVRRADGSVTLLHSTALLLGAGDAGAEDGQTQSEWLGRQDRVVALTDGAIEARDRSGRPLGVAGVSSMVRGLAAMDGSLPEALLASIIGTATPSDDVLVVELSAPE